jgi:hypothetical protein
VLFTDERRAGISVYNHSIEYSVLQIEIECVDIFLLSDYFDCTVGTRQGCMVNPLLFVLFLNELIEMLKARNCKGVFVNDDAENVISLLYPDDIACMADTVASLQQQIDCVSDFCDRYGMRINLEKN